jgi:hypothetical protein
MLRFLNFRLSKEKKAGTLSSEEVERVESALKELESKFPVGQVGTSQKFFFTKKANGSFRIEFEVSFALKQLFILAVNRCLTWSMHFTGP